MEKGVDPDRVPQDCEASTHYNEVLRAASLKKRSELCSEPRYYKSSSHGKCIELILNIQVFV